MGDLHMWTDVVEPLAHRLAAAGQDLETAWRTGRAAIDAGETAIGADWLADNFKAIYEQDRDIVKAIADQAPGEVRGDGELGGECVRLYTTAEDQARAGLADVIRDGG